jgi:hypothetical protein
MSEQQQHTPEPWRCSDRDWRGDESDQHWYVTGDHHESVDAEDGEDVPGACCAAVARVEGNATSATVTEANARRIVACVNACKGIPVEAVEAGAVKDLLSLWQAFFAAQDEYIRLLTTGRMESDAADLAQYARDSAIEEARQLVKKLTEG